MEEWKGRRAGEGGGERTGRAAHQTRPDKQDSKYRADGRMDSARAEGTGAMIEY